MAVDCDIYNCEFDGAQFLSTATLQRRHMCAVEADNNEENQRSALPVLWGFPHEGTTMGKSLPYHYIIG